MTEFNNYSMVRPVDVLGRICIPREIRDILDWNESDKIFIGVKDGTVFLHKFSNICPVCRNPFDNEKGLNICNACFSKLVSHYLK